MSSTGDVGPYLALAEARGGAVDGSLLAVMSIKWAKCAKSASLERGRAQRGAFSSRASLGARPRESTGDVGPYLALKVRWRAVSWP